jgi:hypothetical protein
MTQTKFPKKKKNDNTENSKYVLVKYCDNYADEMDIYGFIALLEEEWKAYKTKLKKIYGTKTYTHSFGTNEQIDYRNINELFDRCVAKSISQSEYEFLLKNFNQLYLDDYDGENFKTEKEVVEYGHFPFLTNDWLKMDMPKE